MAISRNKIIKKILIMLIPLCMIFLIIPALSPASGATEYKLWVNDEQITSEHLTVNCGNGNAVYDPSANTLTLNGAQISTGCTKDFLNSGIVSFLDGLTVIVAGDSSITNTGGEGISTYEYPVPHDLTITGSGKLTIEQNDAWYGYGVYCTGNLTINKAELDITSAASGLWTNGNMTLTDSNIDIEVTGSFFGLVTNTGIITVNNSDITAASRGGAAILLGRPEDSGALLMNSGKLILSGTHGIAEGSESQGSTITINGGIMDITATVKATDIAPGNITMKNREQVIDGSLDGTSCYIAPAKAPLEPTKDSLEPLEPTKDPLEPFELTKDPGNPDTGDHSTFLLFIAFFMISSVGVIIVLCSRKVKKRIY